MLTANDLKSVPLFASLEPSHLSMVATLATALQFAEGEQIFAEGEQDDRFYLILQGRVRISKLITGIGEEALSILDSGAYFGEMSLIDASPRSAHAFAHTAVKLAAIDRDSFEQLLFTNRDLAHDVLWNFVRTLSHRLRDTNNKLKAFFAMTGGF